MPLEALLKALVIWEQVLTNLLGLQFQVDGLD
jgi:hypothetical protein